MPEILVILIIIGALGVILALSTLLGYFVTRKIFRRMYEAGQRLGWTASRGFMSLLPHIRGTMEGFLVRIRFIPGNQYQDAMMSLDIMFPRRLSQRFLVYRKPRKKPGMDTPLPSIDAKFRIMTSSDTLRHNLTRGIISQKLLELADKYEYSYFNITPRSISLGFDARTAQDILHIKSIADDFIPLARQLQEF